MFWVGVVLMVLRELRGGRIAHLGVIEIDAVRAAQVAHEAFVQVVPLVAVVSRVVIPPSLPVWAVDVRLAVTVYVEVGGDPATIFLLLTPVSPEARLGGRAAYTFRCDPSRRRCIHTLTTKGQLCSRQRYRTAPPYMIRKLSSPRRAPLRPERLSVGERLVHRQR